MRRWNKSLPKSITLSRSKSGHSKALSPKMKPAWLREPLRWKRGLQVPWTNLRPAPTTASLKLACLLQQSITVPLSPSHRPISTRFRSWTRRAFRRASILASQWLLWALASLCFLQCWFWCTSSRVSQTSWDLACQGADSKTYMWTKNSKNQSDGS